MNILIVDDELYIREVIKEYASLEGYNVIEASNGVDAIRVLENEKVDLIIMDIMMPKLDGYSAIKEIREKENTPIIVLSARVEEYDKLHGFDLGIDDYVTKPFSPKELMARIKVLLNRGNPKTQTFVFDGLVVDYLGHSVSVDGMELKLTPKEYELLVYFILNKNIALTREQLLRCVWGYDYFGDDRTIDTHIKMLRNNLGRFRNMIVTVRGVGYKFEVKE